MARHGRRFTHIWTDASIMRGRAAGAFVIGRSPPKTKRLQAMTSIRAEIETMVHALDQITNRTRVMLHTDLTTIFNLIYGPRDWRELEMLRNHIRRLRITIAVDAWDHAEYRRCHRAARTMLRMS